MNSREQYAEKLAALGQRVTGIVHELSNPLTTILDAPGNDCGTCDAHEETVRRRVSCTCVLGFAG